MDMSADKKRKNMALLNQDAALLLKFANLLDEPERREIHWGMLEYKRRLKDLSVMMVKIDEYKTALRLSLIKALLIRKGLDKRGASLRSRTLALFSGTLAGVLLFVLKNRAPAFQA